MIKNDDLNDFPVSPSGFIDGVDFYESFLKCEELAKNISKKSFGNDPDFAFYKLLKEVHSSKRENKALFRKRDDAEEALARLWLSRAKEAASLLCAFNKVPEFNEISEETLTEIGQLSADINNIKNIDKILFQIGVIVIYEASIPGMKLDGAVFSLTTGNPVIALSLRYPRIDYFWFTLMHELAHVCLHKDMLSTPILDDFDKGYDDLIEQQADRLASNSLISRSAWRSCQAMYSQSEIEVRAFAAKVGVHPAIVAGRIRNELNRHDIFSKIVNEVDTREVLLNA